jgi:hypothetical protein
MKTRILCIGDSLCLPREEVKYEDTWYYLLKEKYTQFEFVSYFKRALLMSETHNFFKIYYQFYNPQIVVWEIGLTDSAPRYFPQQKFRWKVCLTIVKKLNLEEHFWKWIKNHKQRLPQNVDTPINEFEKYAEILIKNFINIGVKKIILLKVEPIASSVQKKSPFWMDNIAKYNQVYEKLSQKYNEKVILIAPKAKAKDDCFIADGFHPNSKGMKMTFDGIDAVLKDLL